MRKVRQVSVLAVAGLAVASTWAAGGGAIPDRTRPLPAPALSVSWVQPPAWVPIAAPTPHAPAVVGAAQLWVQPPAWIPIAD